MTDQNRQRHDSSWEIPPVRSAEEEVWELFFSHWRKDLSQDQVKRILDIASEQERA